MRDLADTYDQSEAAVDYSIGYSRESLEYTREWVENNDNAPSNVSITLSGLGRADGSVNRKNKHPHNSSVNIVLFLKKSTLAGKECMNPQMLLVTDLFNWRKHLSANPPSGFYPKCSIFRSIISDILC